MLDMHTNVATALLSHLKNREIDAYYSLESDIVTKVPCTAVGPLSVTDSVTAHLTIIT